MSEARLNARSASRAIVRNRHCDAGHSGDFLGEVRGSVRNAPGEAAEERGAYYISFGSDMRSFAPDVFLTGTTWNWAPVMTDIAREVHGGTWNRHPGQDWWYGLDKGAVELAPFSDLVPGDVREMVEEKKRDIIDGSFEVFPGMTDKELREIYYFESNVVGELP